MKGMPHLFRTVDGQEWKPNRPIPLTLGNGTKAEGIWAGSAMVEKIGWWLNKPGHELARTDEMTAVGVRSEKTNELLWVEAPQRSVVFFVLETPTHGKDGNAYRLAKFVTTSSTQTQELNFQMDRFPLFGRFTPTGTIEQMPSPEKPMDDI